MGLGAILLGVFSFVCMFGGAALTPVPFVGTMLSFLSPVLAIAGIVLGGVAMSRAKQSGDNDGLAIAGLVVNVVAFVPAMVVALTCGLCNTLCTGAMLAPRDPNAQPFWMQDAGGGPTAFDLLFPDGGAHPGNVPPPPPAFPPPPPVAPVDPSAPPVPGVAPLPGTPASGTPGPGTPVPGTPVPGTTETAPPAPPSPGAAPQPGAPQPGSPQPGSQQQPVSPPPPPLPPGPTGTAGGTAGGGR